MPSPANSAQVNFSDVGKLRTLTRQVVERAITARIDKARWKRAEQVERAEMASLQSFLETWPAHA